MDRNEAQENHFQKMASTPVERLILSLSVPTIISMLVTNFYNLADTAFVGTLGNSQSGAVGVVFGFMAVLQAVGFMCGQGSGAYVSRRLGARDVKGASYFASTGLFTSFVLGLIIGVLGFCFLTPLVFALGSTETIAPYAKQYVGCILLVAPITTISYTLNNLLRYEGKAFYAMIALVSGAFLNILGDWYLIMELHLGVLGAGIATAASQLISTSFLLLPFLRGITQSRLGISRIRLSKVSLICTTGLPSLFRQALNSVAAIVLNRTVMAYGDAGVAAMSVVSRISFFIFAVAVGIGQGFQPVSGFSYGGGLFRRLRRGYRFTLALSELLILLLGTVAFLRAPELVAFLRNDPEVIGIGTRALRLQSIALFVMPYSMTAEMLFQTTGKTFEASVLSILRSGLFFLPSLLILAEFRGIAGIQEAQPLSCLLTVFPTSFFLLPYFRKLPKADRI